MCLSLLPAKWLLLVPQHTPPCAFGGPWHCADTDQIRASFEGWRQENTAHSLLPPCPPNSLSQALLLHPASSFWLLCSTGAKPGNGCPLSDATAIKDCTAAMQRKGELYSFQLLLRATAKGCEDNREDNLISKTTTTFSNLNSMRNYNFFLMFFMGFFMFFMFFMRKTTMRNWGNRLLGILYLSLRLGGFTNICRGGCCSA